MLDKKLLELEKIHTYDDGSNMITQPLNIGKVKDLLIDHQVKKSLRIVEKRRIYWVNGSLLKRESLIIKGLLGFIVLLCVWTKKVTY